MNTIKLMASVMSIVHFWVEIWTVSMVFFFIMVILHTMVVILPIMMIIWVTMSKVVFSMMITNILVFITWMMFLKSIMVVSWLTSHWCEVNWMVKFSMVVCVLIWLHL